MFTDKSAEIKATLDLEATLKRKMADAPVMSEKRLLCAEMLIVCGFYRDLIEPRGRSKTVDDGHF